MNEFELLTMRYGITSMNSC